MPIARSKELMYNFVSSSGDKNMPIYEYRCQSCHRRVSLLRHFDDPTPPRCPRCGSENLTRLISRVAVLKSEESRLESLADPSQFTDLDERDPKSVARWMRKMSQTMGEDLGDEFKEVVDRLEAGESPESIEQSMPDVGGGGEDFAL
jgi:putative FmdB family regulatory protein